MNPELPPLANPHSVQAIQRVQKPRDVKKVVLAVVWALLGAFLLFLCYLGADVAIRGILLHGFAAANKTNLLIFTFVLLVFSVVGGVLLWQSWWFWKQSKS